MPVNHNRENNACRPMRAVVKIIYHLNFCPFPSNKTFLIGLNYQSYIRTVLMSRLPFTSFRRFYKVFFYFSSLSFIGLIADKRQPYEFVYNKSTLKLVNTLLTFMAAVKSKDIHSPVRYIDIVLDLQKTFRLKTIGI